MPPNGDKPITFLREPAEPFVCELGTAIGEAAYLMVPPQYFFSLPAQGRVSATDRAGFVSDLPSRRLREA
jgi:hypothetical protein